MSYSEYEYETAMTKIDELRAENRQLKNEIKRLKHDLDSYVKVANEYVNEYEAPL